MSGPGTSREIAWVRASGGDRVASSRIRLSAETDPAGGLAVRFRTPRQSLEKIEHRAVTLRRELAARLPPSLESRLVAESGVVRTAFLENSSPVPVRDASQSYLMATWRGVVLGIEEPSSAPSFATPWTGVLDPAEIDPGWPVVLAPCAVLTLVSYALEVSGSHADVHESSRMAGLTVIDTASSPYPPQHYPKSVRGEALEDRSLVEEGAWCDREKHVGGVVDPIFFLLTRPERALRPLAASSHFGRRNLILRCATEVEPPPCAVVVDSWRARLGPRRGIVPFDAELSVVDPERGHLATTAPRRLDFDPWHVLSGILGACGSERAAVDEDPIEGDAHGTAPSLAAGLRLGEMEDR